MTYIVYFTYIAEKRITNIGACLLEAKTKGQI